MVERPSRNSARLAAILDHLPDALLLIDPAGAVVNANARALEVFRAAGAMRPLIGQSLAEVLPGFAPDAGSQAAGQEQVAARALDGTMFPVEIYRSLVPWAGSEDHLLLILRQLSDAALESELSRTSAQARAILRATEEAICGVDRHGKVVLANPAAARLLGARLGEVAGKDLHSLAMHTRLDGSPYAAADTPVGQALSSGRRSGKRREVLWRADGSPVPVDVNTVAIKDGDDVVGAVAAITDVTRGVEEERRRQRLLAVLESELAPALAELAAGDLADLDAVTKQLARLSVAAADAVDYERLMSGHLQLETAPVDVAAVVRHSVDAVAEQARARGVTVDVVLEPCAVAADSRRLGLAVSELLRAAVHASAEGASVTVSTGVAAGRVRIGIRESRVADPARENPLLRWLRPRRSRHPGPDPDLAYVQIVVERSGGRFLLEPASEGARSYVVELPTAEAVPAERPTVAEVVAITEGRTPAAVIPLPTRTAAAPAARREPVRTLRAVGAPGQNGKPLTVLVWPEVARGLGKALAGRGTAPAPVSRISQLTVDAAGDASALLVDALAGPVSRRVLGELRAAAGAMNLPVLVAAGLAEAPAGPVVEAPMLLSALRGPAVASARVLVIEPDPAIGSALLASLERGGMSAVHARNSGEAKTLGALDAPDLVLLGLDADAGHSDIVGWLAAAGRLGATPVLAYSIDDVPAGYAARLRSGASVLAVGARVEDRRIESILAALVARLGVVSRRS